MRKLIILLLVLLLTPLIAGIYGILHDEFTYTICHEYYTKFKFYQFGLVDMGKEAILPNPRIGVAEVGFMATWWTGVIIGIGHGLTGLIQKNNKAMLRVVARATLITLVVTAIIGPIGLAYGKFYLSKTQVNWWFPDNLVDKAGFITVGSMHNFSYLGGVIGLVAGMAYQVVQARNSRRY